MAVKYLAGNRLWGTDAERLAMTEWLTQTEGTLSVAIDTDNNELDFTTGYSTTQLGAGSYDLQSTLGSGTNADNAQWVLRYKVDTSSQEDDSTMTTMISSTQNALTTTSADRIGFVLYSGATYWQANDFGGWGAGGAQFWTDSSAWGASLNGNTSTLTKNGDPIYITIQRTSATVASISLSPNSDYTTSAYTITTASTALPSSVQDLRYITFQSASHNTSAYRMTGTISDVKFWNGTNDTSGTPTKTFSFTTALPLLPNGTTFLTSDTNKLYMFDGTDTWNEVG